MAEEDQIDYRAYEDYVDQEETGSGGAFQHFTPLTIPPTQATQPGARRCTLDFPQAASEDYSGPVQVLSEFEPPPPSPHSVHGELPSFFGSVEQAVRPEKKSISAVFTSQEVDQLVARKGEDRKHTSPVDRKVKQIHPAHLNASESVKKVAMEYFGFVNDIAPKWALNLWLTQNSSANPELPFQEILFSSDLLLATAISTSVPITEAEDIAKSLVRVFQSHGDTLRLLKFSVKREVAATESANTLFRSNSMSSKLLSHYSRMVGSQYLSKILRPHIQQLYSKSIFIEIDPHKLKERIKELESNVEKLHYWCKSIFDSIVQSVGECPHSFRVICNHLQVEVGKRFPEKRVISVGSFIFLRYLCPAIVAPHAFGVMKKSPTDEVQRTLVLISKVLQNLANCAEFGGKEEWMAPMNSFIQENQTRLHIYCNTLGAAVVDVPPKDQNQYPITKDVYDESMDRLVMSITKYQQALSQKFEKKKVTANISYKTLDRLQFSIPSLRRGSGNRGRLTIIDIVTPGDFEPLSNFIDMLFCPTAKLLHTLLDVMAQNLTVAESNTIITSLMKLFQGNGQLLVLLDILCGRDAPRTGSVEGFLASSMTGNVMTDIYALESPRYLKHIMEPLISEICKSNFSFVIDTSVGAEEAKENFKEIQRLTGIFLNRFLTSERDCPMVLRHMFGIFQSYVTEFRLSNNRHEATARSFVINLVCAAMAFPDRHKLVPYATSDCLLIAQAADSIPKNAKRGLWIMSKLVSNIALGVKYKESYMSDMNKLIDLYTRPFQVFLERVASPEISTPCESPAVYEYPDLMVEAQDILDYVNSVFSDFLKILENDITEIAVSYNFMEVISASADIYKTQVMDKRRKKI